MKVKVLYYYVKFFKECCLDMCMWYKFLLGWNGVFFFLDDYMVEFVDMYILIDVNDILLGGIFDFRWFYGEIFEEVWNLI